MAVPSLVHLSVLHYPAFFDMVHSTDDGKAQLVPACSRGLCKPDLSAAAPRLSLGPHPYWLGSVHFVWRRAGKGCIHRGCGSYIHCAYI